MNTLPRRYADEPWQPEHAALSQAEKAELTADYTPAERHEGWVQMQGRPEQGWPARRYTPEMACWAPDDDEARDEDMTGFEAFVLMLVYIASTAFVMWLFTTVAGFLWGWE